MEKPEHESELEEPRMMDEMTEAERDSYLQTREAA